MGDYLCLKENHLKAHIMKKVLVLLAAACCFTACNLNGFDPNGDRDPLPAGKDSLAGTVWEATEMDYNSDGEDVYFVYTLRFLTNNTGEKTVSGISGKATFSYTYNHPKITYKEGNIIVEGTVSDSKNWIYFEDLDYWNITNQN
jgi:hypothetical protein